MTTEIIKKLDEANGKLDQMLQWRAGLEERCKAHNQRTEEIRKILFDNPNGLIARVNRLNNYKRSLSRWRDFWMYILKTVIVAFIIALAAWLFTVYRDSNSKADGKDIQTNEQMEIIK